MFRVLFNLFGKMFQELIHLFTFIIYCVCPFALHLLGNLSRWLTTIFEYFQRRSAFDMQVALRKYDFDPIGMKAVPNRQENHVLDIANPVFGIAGPEAQLEIDRAVTEFLSKAFRFGDL
jgi:hypothetical protein